MGFPAFLHVVDKSCLDDLLIHYSIDSPMYADTNAALHFYSDENAFTSNGVLNITTEKKDNVYKAYDEDKKEYYADTKHVQSAMVQSWNKFCFTGGIVEISAKLPGDPDVGGLWPART